MTEQTERLEQSIQDVNRTNSDLQKVLSGSEPVQLLDGTTALSLDERIDGRYVVGGKIYATPQDGVSFVDGVKNGELFYVASQSDDSVVEIWWNDRGIPRPKNKVFPSLGRMNQIAIDADQSADRAETAANAATIASRVFATPEAGVNPQTGVKNGEYFNVRSPLSEHYIDEYLNNNGVAQATGKSYPSTKALNDFYSKQESINNSISVFAPILPSNTWQQNRDIIQSLNDDLYSKYRGGVIQLPPGEYLLKGVVLDSNIKIQSNHGTVLRHPDNYDVNIFETRRYQTSGSATKGSFTFTVADASNFKLGALVAIRAAGGYNYVNNTLLVNPISATDTANLQLVNTAGFLNAGTLTIDNEIISYTSMTADGLLGGVTRGALGSTAAAHTNTTPIGISMRHVSEIINIAGNEITILDAVKTTVSNVNVMCGGLGCEVVGGKFLGEQQLSVLGVRWNPVQFNLHRFGYLKYFAENCESAFFLNVSSDNTVEVDGKDLGKANLEANVTVGAGGWLFTQCHRNRIYSKFIGNCWAGIYLDNRTSAGTEWDGPCNDNFGVLHCKYNNYNPSLTTSGFLVIGGNDNIFDIFCEGVHTGATVKSEDQMYTYNGVFPSATGNQINVRFKNGYRSIVCQKSAVGNVFTNRQEGIAASPIIDPDNIVLSTNDGGGTGNYLRFNAGSYLRPGITFRADPSFGFTHAADRIRLYKSGLELLNFSETGLNFADGQTITCGTVKGLKLLTSPSMPLGFYGSAPVKQPSIGSFASDQQTAIELVNKIRVALIALGLANGN